MQPTRPTFLLLSTRHFLHNFISHIANTSKNASASKFFNSSNQYVVTQNFYSFSQHIHATSMYASGLLPHLHSTPAVLTRNPREPRSGVVFSLITQPTSPCQNLSPTGPSLTLRPSGCGLWALGRVSLDALRCRELLVNFVFARRFSCKI